MVNTRARHLLTKRCPPEKYCSSCAWGACSQCCLTQVPRKARALLALLTWIAVILLGSSLPGCVASRKGLLQNVRVSKGEGQGCCKLMVNIPCKENLWKNIPGELFSLLAQSQLIGWVLITIIITLAPIAKHISYCCSLVSYLQLKFWKIYSENERELFEIKAKEHANRLAAINMNSCFEATGPEPFQTPSNEDWQKISFIYSFDSLKQYYSMIHNIMEATESASRREIRIPLL